MRQVKLTGREASIVRAIGFTDSMPGAEIHDHVRMESEDLTERLNSLIAAGFVESTSYAGRSNWRKCQLRAFELNPAYTHELKRALIRR
jgi:hypothetical protein